MSWLIFFKKAGIMLFFIILTIFLSNIIGNAQQGMLSEEKILNQLATIIETQNDIKNTLRNIIASQEEIKKQLSVIQVRATVH